MEAGQERQDGVTGNFDAEDRWTDRQKSERGQTGKRGSVKDRHASSKSGKKVIEKCREKRASSTYKSKEGWPFT